VQDALRPRRKTAGESWMRVAKIERDGEMARGLCPAVDCRADDDDDIKRGRGRRMLIYKESLHL
jgi:hypothetical protein